MTGEVGILNVGAGDTKLSFDPANPAECIRAARIVRDMIRRGYALLIEVKKGADGKPVYQRAKDFDEERCEYIIADFDPVTAAEADAAEEASPSPPPPVADMAAAPKRRGRPPKERRIDAGKTTAVAVARTAGG